jgi:tetratricopeptide (TPR) repeat protein
MLSLAMCLTVVAAARAADTVHTTSKTLRGRVAATSTTDVSLDNGIRTEKIPVPEIVSVVYGDEPSSLSGARISVANRRFEDALATLQKINLDEVPQAEIKQDIEFYTAYCAAQLALQGNGDIPSAGTQMANFVNKHRNSFHWLKANEVVGDLLVAMGKYAPAEAFYAKLARAPWPEFQMRAGVLIGRTLLARGKAAEALKQFEGVLAADGAGPGAQTQRLAATLGKARCLAEAGEHDEAVAMIQDVIAKADPEDTPLLAQAYNALGAVNRKAGRTDDALLAFLHVDVLFFTAPDAHAEALANLAELWNEAHKPERALQADQTLKTRYKNSRWAQ